MLTLQKSFRSWAAVLLVTACVALSGNAHADQMAVEMVGRDAQLGVVDALVSQLREHYVFPDVAETVAVALRTDRRSRVFDAPRTGQDFAVFLTDRLRALTQDKHLGVKYSALPSGRDRSDANDPAQIAQRRAAEIAKMKSRNFSITRVERLEHNIGYIDIRGFDAPEDAAETVAATMRFVAHTDALVIDLRDNGGGYPDGVAQIASYFFDRRTHLNDMYGRDGKLLEATWTRDRLTGPSYGQTRPLYLLTSGRTFSGGEDMAYSMQQLKRVTVVGEVTGGGANPGSDIWLDAHFRAFIPFARPVNPISKDNWEGKGVKPDVVTSAEGALNTAQILALQRFLVAEGDPAKSKALLASIRKLEAAD
jgi:retinol-binding protein 3